MEENVKSFLEKIQELKERKIEVYSISKGKTVDSSPLTFKQQKELISTIADGPLGGLRFQKILNDIILENTSNDLTVIDKLPIILKLRIDSIGEILKIGEVELDLRTYIQSALAMKFVTSATVNIEGIEVSVSVPTLSNENKVIQSTLEVLKREPDSELSKSVGNIYTYEICKYIDKITFGEDSLDFISIPVRDRYKIVENLPLALNKEIVKFIQALKQVENDILVYEVDGNTKSFDIDVSFFDS